MNADLLPHRIDETLSLLSELAQGSRTSASQPLNQLFQVLQSAEDAQARAESEDLIWALWCSHENESAHKTMQKAIGAITKQELKTAETLLNQLVYDWPDWAEAWNKRATLHFLEDRHSDSVLDIQRTLVLEPRHFGALSGFGQICIRAGDEYSALMAFDYALSVNPNLTAVRETADLLRTRVARTLH